ncbi:MAG: DUF177 domain-containing protein [Candidatus Poribacteria bacterium]|nr:DUF177 domain-containing protein [Candidatus Poribacteria bacterium]
MKKGIIDTLVFSAKDLRHEDFKEYEALVPSGPLGLTYEEAEFIKPLSCRVGLFRQGGDNIYVTADVDTTVLVECRRCVNPFEVDITTTLDLLFSLGNESSESDDDEERYYDGETLDISEDVRRALTLEIPTWSLCSETCKGLCPECGTELNTTECSCEITDETSVPASNSLSAQLASAFSEIGSLKNTENS